MFNGPLLKSALQGAGLTVLTLFGGILGGFLLGNLVFQSLPGHSPANPGALPVTLAALTAIAGILAGSAAWGLSMGWLSGSGDRQRMALAGILGFVPITIFIAFALLRLEPLAVEQFGAQLPIHRVFTLLFVPSAFLIAGVGAWAIGRGLKDSSLALDLFWRVGLAAGLAFLAVNLVLETLGWVVGAPRAAERFTMLVVMMLGNLGAALAGGSLLGWTLGAAPAADRGYEPEARLDPQS